MNFAKQLADRFWENTEYSIGNPDGLFDAAKNECDKLKKNAHKAIFISRLIELISKDADDHARNCSTQPKEDCDITQNYNHLLFFLTQEFDEFSYQGKDEIFYLPESPPHSYCYRPCLHV